MVGMTLTPEQQAARERLAQAIRDDHLIQRDIPVLAHERKMSPRRKALRALRRTVQKLKASKSHT